MSRVKANNVIASNDRLVNKLQNEIKHLREVLNIRRKGNKQDMEAQLVSLKLENQKLREGFSKNATQLVVSQDQIPKRPIQLNSPDSYYGSNKRYEFSTDVSPEQSKFMRSGYNSKRDSLNGPIPILRPSAMQLKVLIPPFTYLGREQCGHVRKPPHRTKPARSKRQYIACSTSRRFPLRQNY